MTATEHTGQEATTGGVTGGVAAGASAPPALLLQNICKHFGREPDTRQRHGHDRR